MIAFKIAVGVATNPRAGSLRGADPDDRRIFGPLPEGHRPRARLPIDVECGLRLTRRPDQDGEATIAAYEIAATFPFDRRRLTAALSNNFFNDRTRRVDTLPQSRHGTHAMNYSHQARRIAARVRRLLAGAWDMRIR
jgi:hypothetical protein